MIIVAVIWVVSFLLSFGILAMNFLFMRREARKPWRTKIDKSLKPKISVLVPTYNEAEVIGFKLRNLAKIEYPRDLMEIIFVDSQSTDSTAKVIHEFVRTHPEFQTKTIIESERRGKSAALNAALKTCTGDIVVVSDADCFWPSGILLEALPYLGDEIVGAVSGPKKILNIEDSWVTKREQQYLDSMNRIKLGESKAWSTILFEGGFSAYRKEVLDSFDPYGTGSDDCGTVVSVLEKDRRAIMVQEAEFFTPFPRDWKPTREMKVRRATQLIKLMKHYAILLFKKRIRRGKVIIGKYLLMYLLSPLMFLSLIVCSLVLVFRIPLLALFLLAFLSPKLRGYLFEVASNYAILSYAMLLTLSGKNPAVWKKPVDRVLLTETMLDRWGLV
jgi:cellulose synthase/poly-beta-1,6-N-acetylglucosamine synthase-like glycosyltransferase